MVSFPDKGETGNHRPPLRQLYNRLWSHSPSTGVQLRGRHPHRHRDMHRHLPDDGHHATLAHPWDVQTR